MWAGSPATTNLSSGFDSSMISEDSTRVEKEKAEEKSALSDNENDEIKIQQKSNDKRTHISKYLKDEKAKRLSKRQVRLSLLIWPKKIYLLNEDLSRGWIPQIMNLENK